MVSSAVLALAAPAAADSSQAPPLAETAVTLLHADAAGTVRLRADERAGDDVVEVPGPFGEARAPQTLTEPGVPGFAGKKRDAASGLDDFGARDFAARFGRFQSVDPASFMSKTLTNPQDMNLYHYGLNNPFRYGDPDGRASALIFRNVRGRAIVGAADVASSRTGTAQTQAAEAFDAETMIYNVLDHVPPRISLKWYVLALLEDDPDLRARFLNTAVQQGVDSIGTSCTISPGGLGGMQGAGRPLRNWMGRVDYRVLGKVMHDAPKTVEGATLRLEILQTELNELNSRLAKLPDVWARANNELAAMKSVDGSVLEGQEKNAANALARRARAATQMRENSQRVADLERGVGLLQNLIDWASSP